MRLVDRIIICVIASVQLFCSGFALLYLGIGRGPGGLIVYFGWGLLSGLALFTGRFLTRFVAAFWQALILAYFLLKARSLQDALIPAAWIVAPMIYLALTAALPCLRKSQSV
jgi:hypothetical protein